MFKKILIVDDEKATVELLQRFFHIKGYEAVGALRGDHGLLMVKVESPDVVILDLMMPDMDGMEVLRQLRSNPDTVSLPVLMLTANAALDGMDKALRAGAQGYMTKPVRFPELIAELERIFNQVHSSQG
ncbi:MAG: response regulator [Anaerolineae bacterium]|nr:response regulator [Anaerolineae bacterium]